MRESKIPAPTATSTPIAQPSFTYPPVNTSLPKLPSFSGDEPLPKGEVNYMVWRNEVKCLSSSGDWTSSQQLQALRSSLHGTARLMIVSLGQSVSLSGILTKLDAMFSDASSKEELLSDFFNAVQRPDETVTLFACRLETLLQTIIDKGELPLGARDDLLKHRFWAGLSSLSLKAQTRHVASLPFITMVEVL